MLGADHAVDVLEALARYQGTTDDPRTGEARGKVLHELRTGDSGVFGLAPWQPYFGSVDATPLFVMLLAEAWRWGAGAARVRALLPAARRAVAWCRSVAEADPRGHVTYDPGTVGLANHGWRTRPGHLLWVGMLDAVGAEALADRLTAADMDGGWGCAP